MADSIELKHEEVSETQKLKGKENTNVKVDDSVLEDLWATDKENALETSANSLKEGFSKLDKEASDYASKKKTFIEGNITFQTLNKKDAGGKDVPDKHFIILGSGENAQRFEYKDVFEKAKIIDNLMKHADQVAEHIAGAENSKTNELDVKVKNLKIEEKKTWKERWTDIKGWFKENLGGETAGLVGMVVGRFSKDKFSAAEAKKAIADATGVQEIATPEDRELLKTAPQPTQAELQELATLRAEKSKQPPASTGTPDIKTPVATDNTVAGTTPVVPPVNPTEKPTTGGGSKIG